MTKSSGNKLLSSLYRLSTKFAKKGIKEPEVCLRSSNYFRCRNLPNDMGLCLTYDPNYTGRQPQILGIKIYERLRYRVANKIITLKIVE